MNEYEKSLNRIKRNVVPDNWTECDVAHYKTIEKALDKQIPRKVDTEITSKVKALDMDANKVYTYSVVRCPSCGRPMTLHKSRNFCVMCGQALDWSDTE